MRISAKNWSGISCEPIVHPKCMTFVVSALRPETNEQGVAVNEYFCSHPRQLVCISTQVLVGRAATIPRALLLPEGCNQG